MQLSAILRKIDSFVFFGNGGHGHALALLILLGEVECKTRGISFEQEGDLRPAVNIVVAVADLEGEVVVQDIDKRVVGLGGTGDGSGE